jgi:hypothetical protein
LKPLMRSEELLTGKFDFHHHFVTPIELFGYGAFFSSGLITPLVWIAGVAALVVAARDRAPRARVLAAGLAGMVLLVFFTTAASVGLWESLPFLPLFQFPWRMMGPVALMTSIVGAVAFAQLTRERPPRVRLLVEGVVVLACLANAAPQLLAYRPLDPEVVPRVRAQLAATEIRSRGLAATVGDEYLPAGADPTAWRRPRPEAGPVVSATSPVEIDVAGERGTRGRLEIRASRQVELELGAWAFPSWSVLVDGSPRPPSPTPRGTLGVLLEPGGHTLELAYRPPAIRSAMTVVSALALAVWLVLLVRSRRRQR